jgi:hypothetical protein
MGGLFQAQNQQLQQLAPNIMAQPTATGIGGGQFGSLRSQTAADKALTDAQAALFGQQNSLALQNQQTGVQAGNAMGNVGQQYGTTAGALSNLQQTAPLSAASNLSKILGGFTTGNDVTQSTQLSPLSQVGALGSALGGGLNSVNALLNTVSPGKTVSDLLSGLFGSGSDTGIQYDANGKVIDSTVPTDYGSTTGADAGYGMGV